MLTEEDKENILSNFPNIKLSYEKIIHKKVYNFDIAIAVPEGKKSFIWFTFYNDKMLCLLLEFDEQQKKQIKNIKIMNCCFSKFLCYGTIFYGTYFYHENNPFFCIEDIFMYKGNYILDCSIITKINKMCDILKNDIKQLSYNNFCLVFGLPLIFISSNESSKIFENIKYKLSCIKYYNKNNINSHFMILFDEYIKNNDVKLPEKIYNNEKIRKIEKSNQQINKFTKIFIVKPDIQNDIYHLYSLDNEYSGIACIPDFKTSAIMNKLFRKIKENNDLDALEESDDEEEFENPNVDKFVYLEKSYKMICNLNTKFKKWVPIKITD